MPRLGVRRDPRARPARPRRGTPARLAPRRRRQRDREGGRGARRDRLASRRGRSRPRFVHPLLSPPSLLPTMARGGEWPVTYPASCDLTIAVMYLPAQADARGWGSDVRREVEDWIARECAQRRLAGRAPADDRVVAERRDADGDPGVTSRSSACCWAPRRRRPAGPTGRARLLVRRGDADAAGGDPVDRLRAARLRPPRRQRRPHDRRVRAGRRARRCAQGLAVAAMRFCGVLRVQPSTRWASSMPFLPMSTR